MPAIIDFNQTSLHQAQAQPQFSMPLCFRRGIEQGQLPKRILWKGGAIDLSISLEVWGDYASFNRPEMKVERVSYDVITPSAARGLIEAIIWHPGMRWVIDRIQVCQPIRFTNIRRNEVKDVISASTVRTVMNKRSGDLYLATPNSIQQRAAMVLKDVRYIIDAHFEMTDRAAPGDNSGKFQEMARRRIEKGQFYHQPCFGVREFPANFRMCAERPPCPAELAGEKDLGWMLLDMDYTDPTEIRPKFFRARMRDGVIDVPDPQREGVTG